MLGFTVCSSFFLPQSHLGNVLVDMKLIDIKDTLPVGFIPIQETVDTRESPQCRFLPPGRFLGSVMCVFLWKYFRSPCCLPMHKLCLTQFSKEPVAFRLAPGK